jgi:cell division protease FtsH
LLEREVLDATEIKLVIEGKDLPPRPPLAPTEPPGAPVQVLKPERKPVTGGEPAPA